MRGVRGRRRIHLVDAPMHPPGANPPSTSHTEMSHTHPHRHTYPTHFPLAAPIAIGTCARTTPPFGAAGRSSASETAAAGTPATARPRLRWPPRRTSSSCSAARRTARPSPRSRRRCSRSCRAPTHGRLKPAAPIGACPPCTRIALSVRRPCQCHGCPGPGGSSVCRGGRSGGQGTAARPARACEHPATQYVAPVSLWGRSL